MAAPRGVDLELLARHATWPRWALGQRWCSAWTIEGEYCVEGDGELWLHATRFGGVEYRYRMRRVAE